MGVLFASYEQAGMHISCCGRGGTWNVPLMADFGQARNFFCCQDSLQLLFVDPVKECSGQLLVPWEWDDCLFIHFWLHFIQAAKDRGGVGQDARVAWKFYASGVNFALQQPITLGQVCLQVCQLLCQHDVSTFHD